MTKRVPGWLAEAAYITVVAGLGIPVVGRAMETDLFAKASEIPLVGIPLRGVRAWWAQNFNA